MTKLRVAGKIEVPQGTSIYSRWSLAKEEKTVRTINIEDVTTKAVRAALDLVDAAADKTSNKSDGPCGDALAYKLHETINAALHAHFSHPDVAPAFVRASDLDDECCVRNLDAVDRAFKAKVAEAYVEKDRREQENAEACLRAKCQD